MTKEILKKILIYILELEAKYVLEKYKPKIIAVTGSVGKTSTKDSIYTIMSPYFFVRKSEKSFNSEIGVPLTVLGLQNGWNNPFIWFRNIVEGLELIFFKNNYPSCLILEVGADKPGDIKRITKWLHPDVTVITRIGSVPVHVEAFESRQDLINEKAYLVRALKPEGVLILNADDDDVIGMRALARQRLITFGVQRPADINASNERILYEEIDGVRQPVGFGFKVDFSGNSVPIELPHVLGVQHLYPVLAAIAVGSSQGLNMVEVTQAMKDHVPPRGRMNVLRGINNSTIIDDTYNSSPVALGEAFEVFKKIEVVGKKIAVLGDMLELGKFSAEEHKMAGRIIAKIADRLITVGVRARLMKEILAEPEKAAELLVRQEPEWLAKK